MFMVCLFTTVYYRDHHTLGQQSRVWRIGWGSVPVHGLEHLGGVDGRRGVLREPGAGLSVHAAHHVTQLHPALL